MRSARRQDQRGTLFPISRFTDQRAQLHLQLPAIRERVDAHLAGRSETWLSSFAELVTVASDDGVPVAAIQPAVTRLLGDDSVVDVDERKALIDALIGRWAAYVVSRHPARDC